MSFLLIANFKSNKTSSEVNSWVEEVTPELVGLSSLEVAIAPSFPHLSLIKGITLAAQDVSPFPYGSYTGSVNASQLKDLGVKYALIGHSERRRYFHETHQEIANKAAELLAVGITPVMCLDKPDIGAQFAALDLDKSKLVYAYEPSGDIGGTSTAPLQDIESTLDSIRGIVGTTMVLYGGSVNSSNIASLKGVADGTLVASASLEPTSFISLINALK